MSEKAISAKDKLANLSAEIERIQLQRHELAERIRELQQKYIDSISRVDVYDAEQAGKSLLELEDSKREAKLLEGREGVLQAQIETFQLNVERQNLEEAVADYPKLVAAVNKAAGEWRTVATLIQKRLPKAVTAYKQAQRARETKLQRVRYLEYITNSDARTLPEANYIDGREGKQLKPLLEESDPTYGTGAHSTWQVELERLQTEKQRAAAIEQIERGGRQ